MTTTSSHLSSDRVNLLELKDWLRREFLSFFEDVQGKKLIVWDKHLTIPLGLIADYRVLKERSVEKMMDLRDLRDNKVLKKRDIPDISHIFFVVKPRLELMQIIADNIKSLGADNKTDTNEYHIIFVPRKSHLCEKKLSELGVLGSFKHNIKEYFLDLIPLDYDLLSMENPEFFRDTFLYNDTTYLFHIAKSIMTMQTLYGIIPNVYGKGKYSKLVAEQLFRMRKEMPQSQEPQIVPKIDNLILIDRTVDMITPMMTQLTYEGLVDENFGIKYTQLEIPQDKVKAAKTQDPNVNVVEMKKSIVILNSADNLFKEIRDKNFHAINPVLNRTAKELQQANEMKNRLQSVSEIRNFVEKTLKTYQAKKTSLENHMTVAEILKDITLQDEFFERLQTQNELLVTKDWYDKPNTYIMSCMGRGEDIYKVLRLICIHCIANNGFKPALSETYKRELIRAYGLKYFDLLNNMEKAGILYPSGAKVYQQLSAKMNLIVDNVNEDTPNDISYVFSGYAPLSVRFSQFLVRPNWKSYGDLFGLLPGQFFEETQRLPSGVRKRRNSNSSINSAQSIQSMDQKMTLVFFIGGCSYAEVSAFRYLSESNDSNSEFIIATTSLINGKSLLNVLQEPAN